MTDSTNAVEQQVRLVQEEDELRLIAVADLGKRLEELRDDPHQHCRPQSRLVPYRGQLEAGDDPAAVGRGSDEVGDVELRLAEELRATSLLEADERAEEDADGLRRQSPDSAKLVLPGVRVEIGQESAQVGEVE